MQIQLMMEQVNLKEKTDELVYVNPDIRICLICGDDRIESHEFGISCEECGTLFGRSKY